MTDNGQALSWKRDSRDSTASGDSPALEPWVVRLLACPVDRSAVSFDGSDLVCNRCGRRYPVRGGIRSMVADLAKSEHQF
jgi:uncharacterized protein YbaR (Trm112 family)